eukprot:TRINITY_DN81389_c0_g1_i1.p1 TRINITY_DN81389_c0_g1~~TRINITY_DN81389_c0_g1_i1.p1  ORF type:complete len:356 (+),score=35.64 TRINITY_DN81389_c0_g1_i1:54-1121(+)
MKRRPVEQPVTTVLCFGDGNTWGAHGHADKQGQRIAYDARWTTILGRAVESFCVIPEGLNGRTTCMDDPHNWKNNGGNPEGANGRRYLLPCLRSHNPIDLIVLALGCDDLKTRFALSPAEIANGCAVLIRDIKASGCGPGGSAPKIVLLSPPLLRKVEMHAEFGADREEKSLATIGAYEILAREEKLDGFVSLRTVPTSEDGLHFDEETSAQIAKLVTKEVCRVLGREAATIAGPWQRRYNDKADQTEFFFRRAGETLIARIGSGWHDDAPWRDRESFKAAVRQSKLFLEVCAEHGVRDVSWFGYEREDIMYEAGEDNIQCELFWRVRGLGLEAAIDFLQDLSDEMTDIVESTCP